MGLWSGVTHMATNLSHHTISGKGSGKRQYKVHVIAAGYRRPGGAEGLQQIQCGRPFNLQCGTCGC